MPNNSIIAEGKTTNEAIENGLKELKVNRNMVNIKVLDSEKKSFFSILAPRVVKVELTLKNEEEISKSKGNNPSKPVIKKEIKPVSSELINKAEEDVNVFLNEFLKSIGDNITYKTQKDEYGLKIEINGSEAGILIGYRGETLYSLQNIISIIANKQVGEKVRVLIDIEGYREKREATLKNLAERLAKTVEKTKKSVTLEPMQAYERKIIHSVLQENPRVKTESIGEEPRRRIVISLK